MLSLAVSDFSILLLNVLTASPQDFSVLEVPKNSLSTLIPKSSAVLNLELREGSASLNDKAGSFHLHCKKHSQHCDVLLPHGRKKPKMYPSISL